MAEGEITNLVVIQTAPTDPDTIFCMAADAAIGALAGLSIEKAKAQKSEWWSKTIDKKD